MHTGGGVSFRLFVFIIIKVYVIQQGYAHLYKIIQKLI